MACRFRKKRKYVDIPAMPTQTTATGEGVAMLKFCGGIFVMLHKIIAEGSTDKVEADAKVTRALGCGTATSIIGRKPKLHYNLKRVPLLICAL
jgi:hypothetical protein